MNDSTRRVALVTGGAGAFGTAIARKLTKDGWRVALGDIDDAKNKAAAEQVPDTMAVHLDVTDESSTLAAVQEIESTWGRLDGVVNNAGILPVGDIAATDVQTFDRAMNINLRGSFLVTKAALSLVQQSESGRIVMIGSRTWLAGGNPAYTATKAGLVGLARSVALDLAASRATCNVVAPGPVDTPLAPVGREAFQRWADQTLLGRNATPEDVASTVAFFMSPESAFITGEVLHVAGGLQLAVKL